MAAILNLFLEKYLSDDFEQAFLLPSFICANDNLNASGELITGGWSQLRAK